MSWVRIDDDFSAHPKVVEAGPFAAILFVYGLLYCNRYGTDGRIPENAVANLVPWQVEEVVEFLEDGPCPFPGPYSLAGKLVSVGLWTEDDKGDFWVHQYLDYQPSRREIDRRREAIRKARSAAGKAGSKRTANVHQSDSDPPSKRTSNDQQTAQQSGNPNPNPNPRETAAVSGAREGPVSCPADLALTEAQIGTLETGGVARWAIPPLTLRFVAKAVGDPGEKKPLSVWRKMLASAVAGGWNDPRQRPKKPEADGDWTTDYGTYADVGGT